MFDLTKYICENHDEIVRCKEEGKYFPWSDDALEAITKMIKWSTNRLSVDLNDQDDFIQECYLKFFSYIVYKFDPSKNISITTFCHVAFYRMHLRKLMCDQKTKNNISLDRIIYKDDDDEIRLIDAIQCEIFSAEEELLKSEYYAFLRKKIDQDEMLYKHFVEEKNFSQIAREYGCSREWISKKMRAKLANIKKEWQDSYMTVINRKR